MFDGVKRVFVGRPLHSDRMEGTLLPKRVALAVFCSDPISSVAYATEQILLVLANPDRAPGVASGAADTTHSYASWC